MSKTTKRVVDESFRGLDSELCPRSRSSSVMELVPDFRYFINKNQKAFNFFGLDLVNQVLLPGILPGNGTDIRY